VLIAVPNCQGGVSPVFDVAARLTLVHLEGDAELEKRHGGTTPEYFQDVLGVSLKHWLNFDWATMFEETVEARRSNVNNVNILA